jgi:Ribonuclease HII
VLSEVSIVAGVDEVGRGPLAGPVVAGAVVLPKNHDIEGLRDSKKLTKKKRENLYPIISDKALGTGIGIVSVQKIDEINIREATFLAMERALDDLPKIPHSALIDGESLKKEKIPNKGIIKGDDKVDR